MGFFAGFFLGSSDKDKSSGGCGFISIPLMLIIGNILFKKLTNYVVNNFSPYFEALIFMYLLSLLLEFRLRFRFKILVRDPYARYTKTVDACLCFSLLSIPISMILFHNGNIFTQILEYTGAGNWDVDGILLNILESVIYWGCKAGNILTIAFGVTFLKEITMKILILITGLILYRSSYIKIFKKDIISSSIYKWTVRKLNSIIKIVQKHMILIR